MDPITNAIRIALPAHQPRVGANASAPVLPTPNEAPVLPIGGSGGEVADPEIKRQEAVMRAAEDIANQFVLGDTRFSIFKDATGQYITRFTSLRDGRVTYIPEPQLLRLSQASSQPSVVVDA